MKKLLTILTLVTLMFCICSCSSRHICENCGEKKKCVNVTYKDRNGNIKKHWICPDCRYDFPMKHNLMEIIKKQ